MVPQFRGPEMRIWGRVSVTSEGVTTRQWVAVETQPNGDNTMVWVVCLCQVLLLNLGESPFYADWGIPQYPSVMTQVFPDIYTYLTQQRFSQYFLSLTVQKVNSPTPTYNISVVSKSGATISASIPV